MHRGVDSRSTLALSGLAPFSLSHDFRWCSDIPFLWLMHLYQSGIVGSVPHCLSPGLFTALLEMVGGPVRWWHANLTP